jgi:hypothetical protein
MTDVANSSSSGEADKARVEAYVSALQYKYPEIDGNELTVLETNKLRQTLLYDLIEKEKESLRWVRLNITLLISDADQLLDSIFDNI